MKSSTAYYYLIKLFSLLLLGGLPLISVGLAAGLVEPTGPPLSVEDAALIAPAFALLCALAWVTWRNISVVDFSSEEIAVFRDGKRTRHSWMEVERLHQVPFCTPPIYRIIFRSGERPAYFAFYSLFVVSIGVWSWDSSGFRDYAYAHLARASSERRLSESRA